MFIYLCILKLYHARPCAHARLCMLFLNNSTIFTKLCCYVLDFKYVQLVIAEQKQTKQGGGRNHIKRGCHRFRLLSLGSVGPHGKTTNTALYYATQYSAAARRATLAPHLILQ
jgi:hypothetical protein